MPEKHTLSITPSGKLYVETVTEDTTTINTPAKTKKALSKSAHQTLTAAMQCIEDENISLALIKLCGIPSNQLPVSLRFFRELAASYLTQRCQHSAEGESMSPLPSPDDNLLSSLQRNIPPITGAEYITVDVLLAWWQELDQWLINRVDDDVDTLHTFLQQEAPEWHPRGRVCLHLAENKTQPDRPFAFIATYSPNDTAGKKRHIPLAKALHTYAGEQHREALIHLLSPISLAAQSSPLLQAMVDSGEIYQALSWDPQQAYAFLREVPVMQAAGIITLLPDWWRQRPRVSVKTTLDVPNKRYFDRDSLLSLRVDMVVGDETLTKSELQDILNAGEGLLFLKGQWVEVDAEKLQSAMTQMQSLQVDHELSFVDGMRLLAGVPLDNHASRQLAEETKAWRFVTAGKTLSPLLQQIRNPERIPQALPKNQLKATLRPYQETGVKWLWHLNQLGIGACLADDMGLGKTLQVITLLLLIKKQQARRSEKRPSLLLVPTSLMGNWEREIQRFAPSLKLRFAHRAFTPQEALATLTESTQLPPVDLVITSYGMAARSEWLKHHRWHTLILDEAQAIKNPASKQTRAVKQLQADTKLALTGTPIENRLGDLWSLFDCICPGLLGSQQRFKTYLKTLTEREADPYGPLRQLVQPYILRRLKTDKRIIADLPDKLEAPAFCGLSRLQARLYEQTLKAFERALEAEDEGMKRRGVVLSYLMRFKQICNHPAQVKGDGDFVPKQSGKFLRLAELCEEIRDRQEKVLVFTQYREMCAPLADFLATCFQQPGLILHGSTSASKRQERVDTFQQERGAPFFVISLKAGGTGLNLTRANHVIHFDRWWNPAVENQATDRAFRIGQTKNVIVHKFVCQGTVEERIDAMIRDKAALSEQLLSGDKELNISELDDQALIQLVSLDIDRASL